MSIIYDALKKAEKVNSTADAGPDSEKQDTQPKPKRNKLLVYLLVACLGLFAGNIFFGLLTAPKEGITKQIGDMLGFAQGKRTSSPAKRAVVRPAVPATAVAKKQVPASPVLPKASEAISAIFSSGVKREAQPSWVLNGIFFSEEAGYALVNNQIVKVGDTVNGATVREIRVDEVELDNAGSIVKLSTRVN